jgi:hypothetical protein
LLPSFFFLLSSKMPKDQSLNPYLAKDNPRIQFDAEMEAYTMTAEDGVKLIWDDEQAAWFPMVCSIEI